MSSAFTLATGLLSGPLGPVRSSPLGKLVERLPCCTGTPPLRAAAAAAAWRCSGVRCCCEGAGCAALHGAARRKQCSARHEDRAQPYLSPSNPFHCAAAQEQYAVQTTQPS